MNYQGIGISSSQLFFSKNLTDTDNPYYSHSIRWRNTSRSKRFFSYDTQHTLNNLRCSTVDQIHLPDDFQDWSSLSQAQYLEMTIFFSQYLLSSQGDRVSMGHSVEGRYPFLDHRVVEFCNHLPANLKLNGLIDKFILRELASRWLPEKIWRRPKRPYRAPIHPCFFGACYDDYIDNLISRIEIREVGFFNPDAVDLLVKKINQKRQVSETDDMALVGIISTQLMYSRFIRNFQLQPPIPDHEKLKRCYR